MLGVENVINQQFAITESDISGVYLIKPFITNDKRGKVCKIHGIDLAWHISRFSAVETLVIESKKGVLRGLHFQKNKEQSRVIYCLSGKIWCAIVDLRLTSKTYGKWQGFELEESGELYIPTGCALGTLAFEDSLFLCECGENYYDESLSSGIKWNDSTIGIKWPLQEMADKISISEKDQYMQSFKQYEFLNSLS